MIIPRPMMRVKEHSSFLFPFFHMKDGKSFFSTTIRE